MTAAGQDGERLVERLMEIRDQVDRHRPLLPAQARFLLEEIDRRTAAVAPDLDRAGYDRARQECADELRDQLLGHADLMSAVARRAFKDLADDWSSSGRAPAGEEEQR